MNNRRQHRTLHRKAESRICSNRRHALEGTRCAVARAWRADMSPRQNIGLSSRNATALVLHRRTSLELHMPTSLTKEVSLSFSRTPQEVVDALTYTANKRSRTMGVVIHRASHPWSNTPFELGTLTQTVSSSRVFRLVVSETRPSGVFKAHSPFLT